MRNGRAIPKAFVRTFSAAWRRFATLLGGTFFSAIGSAATVLTGCTANSTLSGILRLRHRHDGLPREEDRVWLGGGCLGHHLRYGWAVNMSMKAAIVLSMCCMLVACESPEASKQRAEMNLFEAERTLAKICSDGTWATFGTRIYAWRDGHWIVGYRGGNYFPQKVAGPDVCA